MKAREIMAQAQAEFWDAPETAEGYLIIVDRVLEALTAAGYRILAPGDLDAETVERCAQVADFSGRLWLVGPKTRKIHKAIATAIRSLTPGSMEGRK